MFLLVRLRHEYLGGASSTGSAAASRGHEPVEVALGDLATRAAGAQSAPLHALRPIALVTFAGTSGAACRGTHDVDIGSAPGGGGGQRRPPFETIDVADAEGCCHLQELTGGRGVPQAIVDSPQVGGYDELAALRSGFP